MLCDVIQCCDLYCNKWCHVGRESGNQEIGNGNARGNVCNVRPSVATSVRGSCCGNERTRIVCVVVERSGECVQVWSWLQVFSSNVREVRLCRSVRPRFPIRCARCIFVCTCSTRCAVVLSPRGWAEHVLFVARARRSGRVCAPW